jgi:hypothetical protein
MGNDGPGDIEIALAADDIVELRWRGFISKGTVGTKPDELDAFLGASSPRFALFDASGVTGFSADSREPGGAILTRLKKRGVSRTCVVTQNGAIRMIGSAVALAVGLSIRFFETRALALEEIERLRAAPPPRVRN